jgi:hypothetical protein
LSPETLGEAPSSPSNLIVQDFARYVHDPLQFARYAFPWGELGDLAEVQGPRACQTDVLATIGQHLADPLTILSCPPYAFPVAPSKLRESRAGAAAAVARIRRKHVKPIPEPVVLNVGVLACREVKTETPIS